MKAHEDTKQTLIEQGKKMGLKRGDINVLSIDPYFVGSPKDYTDAKWAADLWDRMMAKRQKQLHLRGFHYWIQSQGMPKPDGVLYAYGDPKTSKEEQDKAPGKDWGYLLHCAQVARYLGIGQWQNLVDLKHPDPRDYDNYWVGSGLSRNGEIDVQASLNTKLEGLVDEFLNEILHDCPKYYTEGYQTTHSEVWCEKNSMGFVIEPICRKYSGLYQPLVGQSSVEKVNMSYKRCLKAARAGKRVRIFYISDWDRYGMSMVPAVARKLEFFSAESSDLDIKLTRIALNEEQIAKFKLPKAPKHGEEVVELDALEAIHPGELGKVVEGVLKPYHDSEKPKIVEEENRRMREKARQLIEEKLRVPLEGAFAGLDLKGIAEFSLTEVMDEKFEAPEPGHNVKENDSWIYDSSRPYWEQFHKYKLYKSEQQEEGAD